MCAAPRRAEDLRRRSLLEDAAGVEEADPVGDVAREAHLVRRDEHRHPLAASSRITSSTSATSSGSSALVTSSRSMRLGCIASARTIATRCCWPPESRSGYSSRLSASPNRREQLVRPRVRVRAVDSPSALRGPSVTLSQHGHVREEVERLEDDPDAAPHAVHVDAARGDLLAVDHDPPGVDGLEQVDAAQERRLAGAGRADQADDLVLRDARSMPRSTSSLPKDLWSPSSESAAVIAALPRAGAGGRARSASR